MKHTFLSKRALSLVEILITIVLLAIVVISCFNFYVNVVVFSIKAENYKSATDFLAETLEKLSLYNYGDPLLSVTTGQPPPNDHHDDPLPACDLRDRYSGVRQYHVDESKWDNSFSDSVYKSITTSITWNDGSVRTLTLSVRKTN